MSAYPVTFESYDINDIPGLIITRLPSYKVGNRDLSVHRKAQAHGSVNTGAFYQDKLIDIACEIGRDTRALLETSLDLLHLKLQTKNGSLIVPQAGANREYTATLESTSVANVQGGHAEVTLTFRCSDPFGKDTTNTTLHNASGITVAQQDFGLTVGGTAELQLPVFTITFTSLSGGSNATVTLENLATGETIEIQRTWANADVLVVDIAEKTVQVNSTDVDFDGLITGFSPAQHTLRYVDTLTGRNISFNAVYKKRYI